MNKDTATVINGLHKTLTERESAAINCAIDIGKLLSEQKDEVIEHGKWILWVKANLTFNADTAARYIRVYERQDELKSVTKDGFVVNSLTDALKLLSKPKPAKKKPIDKPGADKPGVGKTVGPGLDTTTVDTFSLEPKEVEGELIEANAKVVSVEDELASRKNISVDYIAKLDELLA